MHSALGRLLDEPLDLMVGIVEPDGTERVLPFSQAGQPFYNPEQFERLNSITFRGYSPAHRLRFEFNVHSVFYPRDEQLCLMPAIYLEMRVNPAEKIRDIAPATGRSTKVRLFLRIGRDDTTIRTSEADGLTSIDLSYRNSLAVRYCGHEAPPPQPDAPSVEASERIVSLNPEAEPEAGGNGLTIELPVSEVGSGIKWRLVWGAYCGDPIMSVATGNEQDDGRFRYTRYWDSLNSVMADAVEHRDERLARSRLFEKAIDQTPLRMAQRHVMHQAYQCFLANTFWCDLPNDADDDQSSWFGAWSSNGHADGPIDTDRYGAMFYLSVWPELLARQFGRWADRERAHEASGGAYMDHPDASPIDETASFLLLLSAYTRWTADLSVARQHVALIDRLACYLKWTDQQNCAFPTEGLTNHATWQDPTGRAGPRSFMAAAVARLAGMSAAAGLLTHLDCQPQKAEQLKAVVNECVSKIEQSAWDGDHYAQEPDLGTDRISDGWVDSDLIGEQRASGEAYCINTVSSLLLPLMVGQPAMLDADRLLNDIIGSQRETLGPYGCSDCSTHPERIHIGHNLWRDHLARYLGLAAPPFSQCYWDLQAQCNSGGQSMGFVDTYINDNRPFSSAGIVSFGYLLSYPRLVVDRLAPGGARISVDPVRNYCQRWPLLPLADWQARKIPVCVVDATGRITIENDIDPVFVRGNDSTDAVIG